MKPFHEAICEPESDWDVTEDGRAVVSLPVIGGDITVELEPLLFGQYYLAMYRNQELVANKVSVRPGGYPEEAP